MPRGVPKSGYRPRTMGLGRFVGGALGTRRPALLEGAAVQHAGAVMPAACPKCHSAWAVVGEWEARCRCGRRFYRTVGMICRQKAPR